LSHSEGRFSNASELALAARQEILGMTSAAKASHVASALSVVDILSVLYTTGTNISPDNKVEKCRDIVILSKGHAAAALYSVLALQGFFPRSWLKEYCQNGAALGGHVTYEGVPGVELSTGSLGHGLPYGIGIAMARKRSGCQGRIFVILSDGECDEGTTWESAMIANHHCLNNLIVIVDRNRLQSLTSTEDTLTLEPFGKKWEAFGWAVVEVDGHNHVAIQECLANSTRPLCIIAETTKGKGVDFMENSVLWHYKFPNQVELSEALSQLSENY